MEGAGVVGAEEGAGAVVGVGSDVTMGAGVDLEEADAPYAVVARS